MLVLVPKSNNSAQSPDDQFFWNTQNIVCTCTSYIYQNLQIFQKMSENGLFSTTILDGSVALSDVEDNMMGSVKVGLKNGEPCYTLSDGCNTT